MAISKVQTGLRLPESLYDKAVAIAKIENRSLNNLVEYALQKFVSEYEKDHGAVIPAQKE